MSALQAKKNHLNFFVSKRHSSELLVSCLVGNKNKIKVAVIKKSKQKDTEKHSYI